MSLEGEIAALKAQTQPGAMHPMEAKIALGELHCRRLSIQSEAAGHAAEVFNRVVRQKEVPNDILAVALPEGVTKDGAIRVDKLLPKIGLADSVTDAVRKIKANAVEINGQKVKDHVGRNSESELVVQVGKNWRKIVR